MIRLIPFFAAFIFVLYKIYRLNKKVLASKAYIFISKINKGADVSQANYEANLVDFFKRKDFKVLFAEVRMVLKEKYDNRTSNIIYRAETLGFYDTHTKDMFKKRNRVRKLISYMLLIQDVKIFDGNANLTAKDMMLEYWDINALEMSSLDDRVSALKILLESYKSEKKDFIKEVAMQIGSDVAPDAKYLDKEDLDIINEWNKIIKKK